MLSAKANRLISRLIRDRHLKNKKDREQESEKDREIENVLFITRFEIDPMKRNDKNYNIKVSKVKSSTTL